MTKWNALLTRTEGTKKKEDFQKATSTNGNVDEGAERILIDPGIKSKTDSSKDHVRVRDPDQGTDQLTDGAVPIRMMSQEEEVPTEKGARLQAESPSIGRGGIMKIRDPRPRKVDIKRT